MIHWFKGANGSTTGVLVWCVQCSDELNIMKLVANCAQPVDHGISIVDDKYLRVSGNKWINVHVVVWSGGRFRI